MLFRVSGIRGCFTIVHCRGQAVGFNFKVESPNMLPGSASGRIFSPCRSKPSRPTRTPSGLRLRARAAQSFLGCSDMCHIRFSYVPTQLESSRISQGVQQEYLWREGEQHRLASVFMQICVSLCVCIGTYIYEYFCIICTYVCIYVHAQL